MVEQPVKAMADVIIKVEIFMVISCFIKEQNIIKD
jgi:hypothetical protein